MKNRINFLLLLIGIGMLSACEIVGGIFKAGVDVGIFIVVALLVVFFFLLSKIGGKK